ncbi:unnamed protein product [Adineta steineri]|uniref:Ankyrin n=1 Tax=Adineta steineri TaxID=433720 RepID=A0A814U7P4_9BILA|nr:unnamed protein product [Adineta steineri]
MTASDGNSGFLRAARAGNLEKVLEYLRSSIDINTSNANGLNALHLASKEGHVNIVQELLSRGANVNAATKKGNTALHIAALAGQDEVVKLLVKYNANINCQSQNGFSPLYMAAQENHIEVVKFLLANGANQSLATEDGFTPLAVSLQQGHDKVVAILLENDSKGSKVRLPALHIAAKKNDTKAAALLLQGDSQPDLNYKEGGFVNCTTKSGFTPLHIAAHYGNLEVAQLLIARGADVNYAASQNITPLHVASKWGKDNLVKLLLEKGAQIDSKTKDGLTPLHCAARSGHDQVVDLLLESGAPFGAKTKNGLSALHMAAQGDHVDAARILLYYKSTLVDDVSSDYLSALHVASHCGNYNVAKLLCERRADVNAKALNGFSCLHIACKKNRLKLVELLIANDADIEAKTESGLTSLHVAAFVGSHDIVVYLLQHGANIDAITIRGETPLHLAARNNQIDIVQTLLRYGATVDVKAKEAQTCLHLATRLGNIEIVNLLLKSNAYVDNETKDGYSSLHIAAKEGHEEIASLLIDHGANLNLFTKRNFSALHICSKYGNIKVANLLLQKGATPDIQGKNDLTPLHCAVHYNHGNVALLLLQHGASPHVTARNGYTPLHIAAKKNALDIAEMLLEYNANTNAQSTGGFTPLHLSCQDGHSDMTYLLLANHADPNIASKCHLTPLHLCAQEDRVKCAEALVNKQADIDAQTLSGYTSLHVACHFGQINMVRYLLQLGANVNIETNLMFTPLHSAAQQGHVMIVKLLLEHGASPNKTNKHGMTALSIAQRLGYISVVEELKVVTETTIASKHELITEERYKIQAPEVSHEEHPLTDSEDETDMLGDASSNVHMQYLREGVLMTEAEENKLNQTSFIKEEPEYPMLAGKDHWTESRDNLNDQPTPIAAPQSLIADNEIITKPRHGGERFQCRSFLVSFLVDARGGSMRGCRHSCVRVIIPPKRASMPTRITCRFVKREKLTVPPPINEAEALAARVLEVGPVGCKFLGPVILEIPHFASLRNHEREIVVLRSDNGEKWTEHTSSVADDALRDVFGDSVDAEDLKNAEELQSHRITRIITNDFPRFFALITRIRQEASFIDEQGGLLTSTIIPTIQAHIPEKALQKRIRVSLHVLPISTQLVQRSYGSRIHVSPVVTVEPRRRKFHKPITITIPLPTKSSSSRKHSYQQQHGNAYTSDSQTLRLLCSITGGTHAAQFDDITGHTPLTFSNDCATFTTTVSARFWLIDAQGVSDILKLAHEIYREATSVPYMSRFIVFAKRHDLNEALVRIFCITDDKENKTLEMQEHFTEIAKSKEVEVVNGNSIYIDLQSTNLQTIIKTNEQLTLVFRAFKENRLPCVVRLRDQEQEPSGRLVFSKDNGKLTSIQRTTSITMTNGQASALSSTTVIDPQTLQTICNLNILVPAYDKDLLESEERLRALQCVERDHHSESWKSDDMYRKGEIRLTDIARMLGSEWPALAAELELSEDEVRKIMDEFGENASLQMLRYWLKSRGTDATGNFLQQALRKIGKENIVHNCVFNIEWVTDAAEKELAKARLNSQNGIVDGIAISGARSDDGFQSDEEYERRRPTKPNSLTDDMNKIPATTTTTIIKTITFEEIGEDELGGKKVTNEIVIPQFKQLEPLKLVKRDLSKDFIPSSSSTSSVDTIVTVAMRKSLGEHDGFLHFVDSSKAATPASRSGGAYISIYQHQNYSGSITPLSCHSHQFETMHFESLKEKLNRLSYDKADLDDPYNTSSKQQNINMNEGRTTPTANSEFSSKKSSKKPAPFGLVNIVQEATTIFPDEHLIIPSIDDSQKPTAVQQLAEQTSQILDDIPPTCVNQTPVGERFIKSKNIPEQARALAHALKHAVVNPIKKSMSKKKSFDTNPPMEQQLTSSYQPYLHSFSNPSSFSDQQQFNEISVDSYESTSLIALTPPPTKPPRRNDESDSSSSIIDAATIPPAKPPRHFSVYSSQSLIHETDHVVKKILNLADTFGGTVSQDDNDKNLLRETSALNTNNEQILKNIETFSVEPSRIATNTDTPIIIKTFDYEIDKPLIIKICSSSLEQSLDEILSNNIIHLATNIAKNILEEIQRDLKEQNKAINNDQVEEQQTNKTSSNSTSSFPHSIITTNISPTQSILRPSMHLILNSESNNSTNSPKLISPLREIVTRTSTPSFKTSITVVSTSPSLVSSTNTITNLDDELNSNQSESLESMTSKQNHLDSKIMTNNDNTVFFSQNTSNTTSTHSFLSDYDNLHESYGSSYDDNQRTQITPSSLPLSSSPSSSMTTIYESLETISSITTPTYVSAVSTFDTDGTSTPLQRINSDISDDDDDDHNTIDRLSEASTPIIEILEDDSTEPIDGCDMTYLTDNHAQNHQQGLRMIVNEKETYLLFILDNLETTSPIESSIVNEATLAGKGEEPSSQLPPSSSSSEPSLLLISSSSLSSTFPSFSISYNTTLPSSKMPSKNSNIPLQQFNKISSTITNSNEDTSINNSQQEKPSTNINIQTSHHQRRIPLPTKLSFEQNITNLIEKESPLLQSELLTAEHELSVLRSRLAVNEGVTDIAGTILESLKGQFETHRKVDSTTSPLDINKLNLFQQSSAIQTSSTNTRLPNSLEIHYDAESPKSPYLVIKAANSFWMVQPIQNSDVEEHLKKFSSPVMKRATIKLPDSFDIDSDSDDNAKNPSNHNSISEEDENLTIDPYEQLSEMKTIRSSSLFQNDDQFEKFDIKLDEIYLIIDQLKHEPLTSIISNNLQKKIHDLKFIIHNINLNKQDELRIEYELDELDNLLNQKSSSSKHNNDYNLIELFEQNLNELQHLIEQMKSSDLQSQKNLVTDFEDKFESIQNIEEEKHRFISKHPRLIPENPVITSDVFFEGDKIIKTKKSTPIPRLIPEDARISAASFYEGDLTRSLYHHVEQEKDPENVPKQKQCFIPESPLVSRDNFYEGDAQRSMFSERSNQTETVSSTSSPPISIDNLRGIMSDLMLAASWSKRPSRIEKQATKDEEEIVAESFITTERNNSKSSSCEIIHEIENLPYTHPSIIVEEQINKPLYPTIIEEDELSIEKSLEEEKPSSNEDVSRQVSGEMTTIVVSPPSFEQDEDEEEQENQSITDKNDSDRINYENYLVQTSNDVVDKVLNAAISETIEQEKDELYYQTAMELVQNAIRNALERYNSESDLNKSLSSSSSSLNEDEEEEEEEEENHLQEYLSSDDDEENEKLIPQINDQPYLFVNDVVTSKSTQELGDLVQELQILEHKIHKKHSFSSASSSFSENEHNDESISLSIPQIIRTKSVTDLKNLVFELQNVEEQLEDKLDSPSETMKLPMSSQSFNELGGLINELNNVSKQLNNRINEEIFISTNIDSLSEDIIKYRRDSLTNSNDQYFHQIERQPLSRPASPISKQDFLDMTCVSMNDIDQVCHQLQYEQFEHQIVDSLIIEIIREAEDIIVKELSVNVKSNPTMIDNQRRASCHRSTATSISDDQDLSHEDNIGDKTFELAAQLDYLRRMSRYENLAYNPEDLEKSQTTSQYTLLQTDRSDDDDNDDLKSASYLTMVNEEQLSSDEDKQKELINKIKQQQQQMNISQESITQPSSDSLDYHSIEINQIPIRRTTSESSLHSTSSSIHSCETHSLSTSCLIDKDEQEQNLSEIPSNDNDFFDCVKLVVSKPIETIDNSNHQHFQSAHDLHDEEKSKLVRSPELYNMDNVIKHDQKSLLPSNTQLQYRTLSESALPQDDSKRHSLTTSNDASIEYLTALSKENSIEFNQQRLSTPYDDVPEKESSPEQSESCNVSSPIFADAIEPTSSCQRPLAFRVPGQQRIITDEEYFIVANDLANQVLHDVLTELNGEQDDLSQSNTSDKLSISSSTSSDIDDDDDKLIEVDEEADEYIENKTFNDRDNYSTTTTQQTSNRTSFSKGLRRAQTDAKDFDIIQSPYTLNAPLIRCNSQSDTEVYFRSVSPSMNDYRQYENSSSDEESSNKKHKLLIKPKERYSGEGEESSGGEGKERTHPRRKRSNDQTNIHESPPNKNVTFKLEINDNNNVKRQESLDSPPQDLNEKSILKSLQEGILRINLESIHIDLKLINQQKEKLHENIYASITKKPFIPYDYDAGSETDRDDLKIIHTYNESITQITLNQSTNIKYNTLSIDIDIKNLLEELIESINDDLTISISSESQSDATTVIFNSNKTSMDDEENIEQQNSNSKQQNDKQYLSIQPISSSSSSSASSSAHSVIYHQQQQQSQMKTSLPCIVHTKTKKQLSTPSFSNIEHCTKKKFRSYPGSLGGTAAHITSSPITSTPDDYYTSITTTSTTFQSGNEPLYFSFFPS